MLRRPPGVNRQQGIALLLLAILMMMAGLSAFLAVMNSNLNSLQQNQDSLAVLREARERLIAYAVMHGDLYGDTGAGPGHLPCPDGTGDGGEDSPCAATLGRLPQALTLPSGETFPLSNTMAGFDQQPWYGIDPSFRRAPTGVLNSSVNGALGLDGRVGIAAVLIAPGEALLFQSRPGNGASNYLEAGNATGPNYVTVDANDPNNFNDRVLSIAATEILTPVTARVAETIKGLLDDYHGVNGTYPVTLGELTTALASAPAWFTANAWDAALNYSFLSTETAAVSFTGCGITYTLTQTSPEMSRSANRC